MTEQSEHILRSVGSIYGRLFRSPAAVVFMILFLVLYTVISVAIIRGQDADFMRVVEAAPLAISGFVVGFFSVLFWALNYVSRERKHQMRIEEASALFDMKRSAIEAMLPSNEAEEIGFKIFRAHLLFVASEFPGDADIPGDSLAFNYADVVKTLVRRG